MKVIAGQLAHHFAVPMDIMPFTAFRLMRLRALPTALLLGAACARAARGTGDNDGGRSKPIFTTSDTTARFAPGVIPAGSAYGMSLTPDGRTAYFTRSAADGFETHIVRSMWTASGWSPPQRADFSTGPHDQLPQVSPDGNSLRFTAPRRRQASITDRDGDLDIWLLTLDQPSEPIRDGSLANSSADESSPSLSFEPAMFFARTERGDTVRSRLLYWRRALRSTPVEVSVGLEVTQPLTPFVSRSGRVLLISARPVATGARADLYVMVRRGDGKWSAPRALGREVNSSDAEFAPSLSPDQETLFFSRRHAARDGVSSTDIYVVPVRSVPVLRDALVEPP